MTTLYDELQRRFHRWDSRGRGLVSFEAPVSLRPPFIPFTGHRVPHGPERDTGRRHTPVSGFLDQISQMMHPRPAPPESEPDLPEEAYFTPEWSEDEESFTELALLLPDDFEPPRLALEGLFHQLTMIPDTLAFEIVATAERSWLQWAVPTRVAGVLRRQMATHFPSVSVREGEGALAAAFSFQGADMVVEFALAEPLVLPLGAPKTDLFLGLIGSLADLEADEAVVYQVLFTPAPDAWGDSARRLVENELGKPLFDNGAHFVKGAAIKMDRPLYTVGLRLAARTSDLHRSWDFIHATAPMLRSLRRHEGNGLLPVRDENLPMEVLADDVLHRRTRRWGMLLNLDELMSLAHLPHPVVQSPTFHRASDRTRSAAMAPADGLLLGFNEHNGREVEVRLGVADRLRHLHIIGGTGSGKSTLLLHMVHQGLQHGEGLAVFDPHGDLIDRILGLMPEHRMEDVILVDPSDEETVVPFNVLSAHSDLERTLLSSDLVSIFKRLSTSWGDQMDSVLRNAIIAFLESSQGGSLTDLRRFLVDSPWREQFLHTVDDPDVQFYWKRTFPQLGGGKSIGPILTRLQTFLLPKSIRHMVGQRENRLDFAHIMDTGKILLLRLPQGLIGPDNAYLLGSLFMAKLQQTAMGRQKLSASQRRPFFIYVDEAQAFLTPSMREILTGTRKYGLGLALAHHELRQLEADRDVGSALLSNAYTRIVFKVGDADARTLSEGLSHFQPSDLQSLPTGHALCRLGSADTDFNLCIAPPHALDDCTAETTRSRSRTTSQNRYSRLRTEVEAEQRRALEATSSEANPGPGTPLRGSDQSRTAHNNPSTFAANTNTSPTDPPSDPKSPIPTSPMVDPIPPGPLPGKGGPRHIALQNYIKTTAEGLGFRAQPEFRIGNGHESVDVVLTRDSLHIAVEISNTTSVDDELSNLRKCLRTGFSTIAILSDDEHHVTNLSRLASSFVEEEPSTMIRCESPAKFISYLASISTTPGPPQQHRTRGFKVKRVLATLSPNDQAAFIAQAFQSLVKEMSAPQFSC